MGSTRYRLGPSSSGRTDFFFVLLLVAISGNPVLASEPWSEAILLAVAALSLSQYRTRVGLLVDRGFVVTLFIFVTIQLIQVVTIGFVSPRTIVGFCIRLWIAYAIVRSVNDFPVVFVKVMTVLAALSLLIWMPDRLLSATGLGPRSVFAGLDLMPEVTKYQHLGFHSLMNRDSHRNSGFFWEPGAFAGYLVLALLLLSFVRPSFAGRGRRSIVILTAAALSTFSTTGYLALPVALLVNTSVVDSIRTLRVQRAALIVGAVILGAAVSAGPWIAEQGFLIPKLVQQYEQVRDREPMWELTRYGSLIFDLEYIRQRPLLGWGLHPETRYSLHPGTLAAGKQGNGMSDFTVKLGLTGLLCYLTFVATSFYRMSVFRNTLHVALGAAVVLVLLNGEAFLNYPLFLCLMFLPGVRPPANDRNASWSAQAPAGA